MTKRRRNLPADAFQAYDSIMPQIDSDALIEAQSSSRATKNRRVISRREEAANPQKSTEIQPLPRWVKVGGGAARPRA